MGDNLEDSGAGDDRVDETMQKMVEQVMAVLMIPEASFGQYREKLTRQ